LGIRKDVVWCQRASDVAAGRNARAPAKKSEIRKVQPAKAKTPIFAVKTALDNGSKSFLRSLQNYFAFFQDTAKKQTDPFPDPSDF